MPAPSPSQAVFERRADDATPRYRRRRQWVAALGAGTGIRWRGLGPSGDLGVCESGDVGCVELLEFNGGAPAQGVVASLPIVEDLRLSGVKC
jgi:hypothetical protein